MGFRPFLSASLALLALSWAQPALSCTAHGPRDFSVFLDSSTFRTRFSGARPMRIDEAGIQIQDCDVASSAHALQIGLAPIEVKPQSGSFETSLNRDYRDDQCRVLDPPRGSAPDFTERHALFETRFSWLDACVVLHATEVGVDKLEAYPEQPGCQVTRISDRELLLTPGYCFLRISPGSQIAVVPQINPRCGERAYLRERKLKIWEVAAQIEIAETGDATGRSPLKKVLSSHFPKMSLNPEPSELLLSDVQEGQPVWPGKWVMDVALGNFSLRSREDGPLTLDLPLWVDHRSGRSIQSREDPLLTSPCDFSAPLAASVSLVNTRRPRNRLLEGWVGGPVPAQWQGILKSVPLKGEEVQLTPGDTYELTLVFSDPYEDNVLFRTRLQQIRIDLGPVTPPADPPPAGIGGISPISPLPGLQPAPRLPALPPLNESGGEELADLIARIDQLIGGSSRSIFFQKVCWGQEGQCAPSRSGNWLTLTSVFTVDQVDPDTGAVTLSHRRDSIRVSTAAGGNGQTQWLPQGPAPRVQCGPVDGSLPGSGG